MLKLLQICFRPQVPANDGGAIAMHSMSKSFEKNWNVDLKMFVFNTHKHNTSDSEIIESIGNKNVTSTFLDTRIKPVDAFIGLFKTSSYNMDRFNSATAKKDLEELLLNNAFDVIQFEGLYTSTMLKTVKKYAPKAKTVLRSHNIEHLIWERRADQNTGIKKVYLKSLAKKLKKYEDRISKKFDAVVPITDVDHSYYYNLDVKNIFVSSTGVDTKDLPLSDYTISNSIFHLGSLDWEPNQEAIIWFLKKVWPSLKSRNKDLKFYIAGKNMPKSFLQHKTKGVEILGEVPDAREFIINHGIMIVPLLSGSGMRIKIIEGMSLGCPIVSTSIGAEGIFCKDNLNIIIANTASNFIHELEELVVNQERRTFIGKNAKQNILENYSNDALIEELVEFYKSIVY